MANEINRENLGPAEQIINTVLAYTDHLVHNRPGMIVPDRRANIGVRWLPVTHKVEDGKKIVYELNKVGRKTARIRRGELRENGEIYNVNQKVGDYRPAGLFPEVAAWMYRQVAEVWKLDNEFAARWASYAFPREHRDIKVVLAAFMLVQTRKGAPVTENGELLFYDADFRDVGEAMALLRRADKKDLNPKLLLRVCDLLNLPQVAEINRELGFGHSARKPFTGRWSKTVRKWLQYREENIPLLEGLVKAGYRKTVMELARRSGYKPTSPKFFQLLRWKQAQAKDGRRSIAIGDAISEAESWDSLTEEQICQKIINDKPNFKRIVSFIPNKVGLTRAIFAASIEAGCLSDKDLIIQTPTMEELGLLNVQEVRERWESAIKKAEDMRAANIASRVRNKETKEKLQDASDNALKEAVKEVSKDMRIYIMVDISGSMNNAIETAKDYISKFLQAFPLDRMHVCVFNTAGREITIRHASAKGVANAFSGISAGGGTDYSAGVRCLQKYKPQPEEDVLFIFVGDEGAADFPQAVRQSGLNPLAFGLIKVVDPRWGEHRFAVQNTANTLQIPCMKIDEGTFSDPYAIPRTIQNLIASTPIGQRVGAAKVSQRISLIDEILKTDILQKPVWTSAA